MKAVSLIHRQPKQSNTCFSSKPCGAFTLQVNEEETVSPDALGIKGNRYLIVKNMSSTEKGAITVEIV